MDYQKKFPITQLPGEFVLAEWNRSYKGLTLSYKGRVIGTVGGIGRIRQGITLQDEELNTIVIKFSEKPIMLDLIIDGYHSRVNGSHPAKELKRLAPFFWIISALSFVAGGLEVGSLSDYGTMQMIFGVINTLIVASYIVAGIFTARGQAWAYLLGFVVICVVLLFHALLLLLGSSGIEKIFFVFRVVALGVLIYNLKTVIAVRRHARYGTGPLNEELLDAL